MPEQPFSLPDPVPQTKYRAIPEPTLDLASLQNTVLALKEVVEMLTLQRVNSNPPIFWDDLERMGYATKRDAKFPWASKT